MKSIHTTYSGYSFRSRLEARHAVWLDAIHEPWTFEPDYVELSPGVRYLPDFWLPRMELWIEVKGRQGTDSEISKARALADASGYKVLLSDAGEVEAGAYAQKLKLFIPGALAPDLVRWGVCEQCQHTVLSLECCGYVDQNHRRLLKAMRAARSARFEFGQRGAVNPDRLDPAWKQIGARP